MKSITISIAMSLLFVTVGANAYETSTPEPSPAPVGTYSAQLGPSCFAGGLWAPNDGVIGAASCTPKTVSNPGREITINIKSYTTQTQLQSLKSAYQSGGINELSSTLRAMNQGTVTIGDVPVPINAAFSLMYDGKYFYTLITAAAALQYPTIDGVNYNAAAGAVGVIQLEVTPESSSSSMNVQGVLLEGSGLVLDTSTDTFGMAGEVLATELLPPSN